MQTRGIRKISQLDPTITKVSKKIKKSEHDSNEESQTPQREKEGHISVVNMKKTGVIQTKSFKLGIPSVLPVLKEVPSADPKYWNEQD